MIRAGIGIVIGLIVAASVPIIGAHIALGWWPR